MLNINDCDSSAGKEKIEKKVIPQVVYPMHTLGQQNW